MPPTASMPTSQRIVQVCLFLVAAICLFGGTLQMVLPEPATVWLGYLIPELVIPFIIALAHSATQRNGLGMAKAA